MAARTRLELSPGDPIGAYEVRRLVGRGETACVYEGRHRALGRAAAVKVLHARLAHDTVAVERFLRLGRDLSRIVHPNVVEVFDLGEHDGAPYLVTSLVDGDDLGEYLRDRHPMRLSEVADFVLCVVSAVAAAQQAGVAHRDVKPSNIRVASDHRGAPTPRVLDFGISKLTGDERGAMVRDAGGLLETACYLPPEHVHVAGMAGAAGSRSDVYSLGVLLYEAAAGRRPFEGATASDLLRAILAADLEPPSAFRPEPSPELDAVVLRAMHRDPEQRFVSARELGRALAAFASHPAAWVGELAPRSGIVARPPGSATRERSSG